MYIRDMLSQRLTFSCELFPPKKGADLPEIFRVVGDTAAINPDFISVTCGAAMSTSANTVAVARHVESTGVTALAHLTCVSLSRRDVPAMLETLQGGGVGNILALRGDLPEGQKAPLGDMPNASHLMEEISRFGGFSVGGACYPEGHVECQSPERDIENLKKKVDAGCDFLTSQMFFDNNVLYRFLYRMHSKGITLPVIAGIMPVTNKKQIGRIIELSGTYLPPRFKNILDRFGDDGRAMQQAGIAYAAEQIIDLIANGVRGVHIYTMNRPEVARSIAGSLSHILRHEKSGN